MELNIKSKISLVILLVIIIIFVAGYFILFHFRNNEASRSSNQPSMSKDYVIEGVPYFGLHNNHYGKTVFLSNDLSAAVFSLLEYWNPGQNDLVNVGSFFTVQDGRVLTADKVYNFFDFFRDKDIYEKPQAIKMDIDEFGKYVNPEKKTPIIVMMPLISDQPKGFLFNPAWLLIGIKNSEKRLVFHNYWQGNNYEINFDDFNKIKETAQKTGGSACILIQPKNLSEKLDEIKSREKFPSQIRTSIMNNGTEVFNDYALGRVLFFSNSLARIQESLNYLLRAKNNPNFEEFFPPILKVRLYNTIAMALNSQEKIDEALQYANLAADLNHDLNNPFKDYSGYDSVDASSAGQLSETYVILGDIYRKKGDLEKAKENYQKALNINANNKMATSGLQSTIYGLGVNLKNGEQLPITNNPTQ